MVENGGAAQFRQRSTRIENATNESQRVCSEIPLEHRRSHSAPFLGGEWVRDRFIITILKERYALTVQQIGAKNLCPMSRAQDRREPQEIQEESQWPDGRNGSTRAR